MLFFFFFNDTATTEIYTLSLHDALPICALMFHLESSKGRMSSIAASYMNNGRVETKEEVIRNINNVSLEDVQEVAKYLFNEKYYSCTVLGNIKEGEFAL